MGVLSSLNLEPGNVVGGYTLISRLGGGAMGSVWRVRDDGGNVYAMKILRDSLSEDEDTVEPQHISADGIDDINNAGADEPQLETNAATARERLRREATALRKIDHPGVCRIEDMELDDSLAFIVTELIEGNNLRQDVAINGKYIGQDLERLAAKLMEAVAAVHNAGIIHRDIKPTNVMVATTGPMLVDFGIAMGEGESHVTRTGLVMGTPGFIAPEIIDGAESDETTDWWSTAAVLAFAATGKPVFGSKPMMAVLERAASGRADLQGLPAHTAEAFRRALHPDPAQRGTPQDLLVAITQDAMHPELWQTDESDAVPIAGKPAVLQQGGNTNIPTPPAPPIPPMPPASSASSAVQTAAPSGVQSHAMPANEINSRNTNANTQGADGEQSSLMRPFGVGSSGNSITVPAPPTISQLPSHDDMLHNPRLAWQHTPLPNLDIIERQLSQSFPTMAVQQPAHMADVQTETDRIGSTTVMPSTPGTSDSQTTVLSTPDTSSETTVLAHQPVPYEQQAAYPYVQTQQMHTPLPYAPSQYAPSQYAQPSYEQTQYMQPQYEEQYTQPDVEHTQVQPQYAQPYQPQYVQAPYAQAPYAQPQYEQSDCDQMDSDNDYARPDEVSPSDLQQASQDPQSDLDTSINPDRGRLILAALALPLCLLAACAPAWSIIIGGFTLLTLATLGIARQAFVARIERRGKRGSTDIPVALGALPWHIVQAIASTLPAVLVLFAVFTLVCAALTAILQLPTARTHSIMFDLQISMPLIVGAPASAAGLALAMSFACGWLLTTFTSYGSLFAKGAATIREIGLNSAHPRLRLTLLALWGVITLAAFATCLASASFDWYPFASFVS